MEYSVKSHRIFFNFFLILCRIANFSSVVALPQVLLNGTNTRSKFFLNCLCYTTTVKDPTYFSTQRDHRLGTRIKQYCIKHRLHFVLCKLLQWHCVTNPILFLCKNFLHVITWYLYTVQVCAVCANLTMLYAILFVSCFCILIPLWTETC
jgi:hypothetical protein